MGSRLARHDLKAQQQEKMGLKVEERIAAAICKNPRLMKAGITLEFKEVVQRVSQQMINNMDKHMKKYTVYYYVDCTSVPGYK